MREGIGAIIKGAGYVAWVVFGIWGMLLCYAIVNQVAGFWGIVLGLTFLPMTFIAAPWYAALSWGNWLPLLIIYGGGISATVLFAVGSSIAGDN